MKFCKSVQNVNTECMCKDKVVIIVPVCISANSTKKCMSEVVFCYFM